MKNMLDDKLAQLSAEGESTKPIANQSYNTAATHVTKTWSSKDMLLWLVAFIALISATLVTQYLPKYWQPASNLGTQIAVIAGLVMIALMALALTQQGRSFKTLLIDARTELGRVTWPSKAEVIQYTWQVLLGLGILALLVWILDTLFGQIIKLILG